MDRSWTSKRIPLILVLLVFANMICLHGNPVAGDQDLHCVTDYLFTINCTTSLRPSEDASRSNSSYWLLFTETHELETFQCMLTNTDQDYSCSVQTSDLMPDDDYPEIFTDTDTFKISLCHRRNGGSEKCDELDDNYVPVTNIKPNAPCCLTVSHNSGQHHFTWRSTYEEYSPYTYLGHSFKYQLDFLRRGEEHDNSAVILREIRRTNYSLYDHIFVPDTEYTARVRSIPDLLPYKGEWSDWSSEAHWRTGSAKLPRNEFDSEMRKVLMPLCVLVPLFFLMCYVLVKIRRLSAFIPTPAPFFHTLYSDCHGDFKSWAITPDVRADTLKAETSLHIDNPIKCADVPEDEQQSPFHPRLTEGNVHSNLADPVCDTSLLGVPCDERTTGPLSVEGDSGCWVCSDTSVEKDSLWHCNKYCTLMSSSPVTAEHHGSLPTSLDATGET